MLTRPEEFENERFRSEMFSVHTTPFGEVSVGEITWLPWHHLFKRLPFQNSFTPHENKEESFWKAAFLWRISVDGRPNRRNKAPFSNFSVVVDELLPVTNYLLRLLHCQLVWARSSRPPRFACYQKQKHSRIWLQLYRLIHRCKTPLSTLTHWTVKNKEKRNDKAIISIKGDCRMTVKLFNTNASEITKELEVNNTVKTCV